MKGNVINVPADIQPMNENFTTAVQLKKKLSYKKVDFKENVRPLRVLTALHWLVNMSELYKKKSGIVVDDNWIQEVTESAEDTVREFLEVSKQVKEKHKENSLLEQEVDKTSLPKDNTITDKYDSDHFSEMKVEKVVIPCHDTLVSANISPKTAQELISQVPDDASVTANLEKFLTVAAGMKYVMSVNVNLEDGLTNGATGVVKFVEYKIEGSNRPSIIWMKFDDPRIGKATRGKYFQRGFYNSNIQRDLTPVFEVEERMLTN